MEKIQFQWEFHKHELIFICEPFLTDSIFYGSSWDTKISLVSRYWWNCEINHLFIWKFSHVILSNEKKVGFKNNKIFQSSDKLCSLMTIIDLPSILSPIIILNIHTYYNEGTTK